MLYELPSGEQLHDIQSPVVVWFGALTGPTSAGVSSKATLSLIANESGT